MKKSYDIAIVGGGLSGMTLACLLGQIKSLSIACIDQEAPEKQLKYDERTTAISYGSSLILERAGIWNELVKTGCPLEDIRILDGNTPILLQFLSSEVGGKSFGWNLANRDIRQCLLNKLATLKNVDHLAPEKVSDFSYNEVGIDVILGEKKSINARLVIGADGRKSKVRDWMEVPVRGWNYNQRAIVCYVLHENPHENKAIEHFWPQGPFAILPMCPNSKGQNRSSLVFTEHGSERKSLMHKSNEEFEEIVAQRFPEEYGKIEVIGPRMAYPLSLSHASKYIAPRVALVADAAHGIHPIAGQGLNLGFRDLDELSRLIQQAIENNEDFSENKMLETYQRRRRPDNMAMIAVTDALVHLFSNDIPPVRIVRQIGLKAVSRFPIAKDFFMRRAMGA